jgi:hypothetical protein
MLRISQAGTAGHSVTLKLEGRVVGPWVPELRQACERLLSQGQTLKLDLTGMTFADTSGVTELAGLKLRGVILTHCSPFVEAQLKSPARD